MVDYSHFFFAWKILFIRTFGENLIKLGKSTKKYINEYEEPL